MEQFAAALLVWKRMINSRIWITIAMIIFDDLKIEGESK